MRHANTDNTLQQYELPEYSFFRIENDPSEKIIKYYGSDILRFYVLSLTPGKKQEWNINNIHETAAYLKWIWITGVKHVEMVQKALHCSCSPQINNMRERQLMVTLNETIKAAGEHIATHHVHKMAGGLRNLSNSLHDYLIPNDPNEELVGTVIVIMIKLLSAICPCICNELWQNFGYKDSVTNYPWPTELSEGLQRDELYIAVLLNGTLRNTLKVPTGITQDKELLTDYVLNHLVIKTQLAGQKISQVTAEPGKPVNIVTE